MKQISILVLALALLLSACGSNASTCTDLLGCVIVESGEPITIAVALTLSGTNSPYGTDALRGVELAIADQGNLLGREIALIQQDEGCTAEGGELAARALVQNADVTGVIGTTCSSAAGPAAKVISEAGMVLISPSATAASLTSVAEHQSGFLRTIYNDISQARLVAEFAFSALGAYSMATIHDGTPYSKELQEEACKTFEQLGGKCVTKIEIRFDNMVSFPMQKVEMFNPDVLYFPVYTSDGVLISSNLAKSGLVNVALIGSDGLLNADFVAQTKTSAQGMYISGPSVLDIPPSFYERYQERFGEEPIAVYAAQAYDAAGILFAAIEKSAKRSGSTLIIPRTALREALFATSNFEGLSGTLTCSPLGDCASPSIVIYQLRNNEFIPIYP